MLLGMDAQTACTTIDGTHLVIRMIAVAVPANAAHACGSGIVPLAWWWFARANQSASRRTSPRMDSPGPGAVLVRGWTADGARASAALRAGSGRVAAGYEVPVPARHRVRPDQQPEPAQHTPRQPVQQGGQECPGRWE